MSLPGSAGNFGEFGEWLTGNHWVCEIGMKKVLFDVGVLFFRSDNLTLFCSFCLIVSHFAMMLGKQANPSLRTLGGRGLFPKMGIRNFSASTRMKKLFRCPFLIFLMCQEKYLRAKSPNPHRISQFRLS